MTELFETDSLLYTTGVELGGYCRYLVGFLLAEGS